MKRLLLALGLLSSVTNAVPINGALLSFDGLQAGEQVLSYYAGGLGGDQSGPGPAYGISFTPGLAANATTIAFGPSAMLIAPAVTMNLDSPWSQVISFYFTGSGTVSFYTGANVSGNLVASYVLNSQPFFPFGQRPGAFQSVVFASTGGSTLRLDSIDFGSLVIPEPSNSMLLLTGGVMATIYVVRLRQRQLMRLRRGR
jgi:hypothetical protein